MDAKRIGNVMPALETTWCRRLGMAAAFAALIAAVGNVVSGPGEPGTALGGMTGASTGWSSSFSLIATSEWWEPPPPPPPAAPPPLAAPAPAAPQAPAEPAWEPPAWQPPQVAVPPPPPPPPPPQLMLRFDNPGTAVVSIANQDKPAVGCMFTSVAVAGIAAGVHYTRNYPFTVTGSAETRIDPDGPATGSSFHVTVTCDNGLSGSTDAVY